MFLVVESEPHILLTLLSGDTRKHHNETPFLQVQLQFVSLNTIYAWHI